MLALAVLATVLFIYYVLPMLKKSAVDGKNPNGSGDAALPAPAPNANAQTPTHLRGPVFSQS